jgi:hypothetical protein
LTVRRIDLDGRDALRAEKGRAAQFRPESSAPRMNSDQTGSALSAPVSPSWRLSSKPIQTTQTSRGV